VWKRCLVGEDGTVQALWLTYSGERSPVTQKDTDYHLGLATPTLLPVIQKSSVASNQNYELLSVEFNRHSNESSSHHGVSEE